MNNDEINKIKSGLTGVIKTHRPSCLAATLVGSSVTRGIDIAADFDVIGFDLDSPLSGEIVLKFNFGNKPVHVVLYHPQFFPAVISQDKLIIIYLRELRKILDGAILFDDHNTLEKIIDNIQNVKIPIDILRPFFKTVDAFDASSPHPDRLIFYQALENFIFAWLNLSLKYRYTKPKWILEDAKSVSSKTFHQLLTSVSEELTEIENMFSLMSSWKSLLSQQENLPSAIFFHLNDADFLINRNKLTESVWSFRTAIYQYGKWRAEQMEINYQGIHSLRNFHQRISGKYHSENELLERVLLLRKPIPSFILELWQTSLNDFYFRHPEFFCNKSI